MSFKKVVMIGAALAVLPLAGAFARGAGGFTWGEQYFAQQLSNLDIASSYTGVYGYNLSWGGQRYGGFVMAIHSDSTVPVLDGGFVGGIAGQEMRLGPFIAAVTAWTGFGGMNLNPLSPQSATFALIGELNLELSFGFLPGVMITGYAGMQAVAPVVPEEAFLQRVMYTPVVGMRIAWGS